MLVEKSNTPIAFAAGFQYILSVLSFCFLEVFLRMPIMTRMRDSMPTILFALLVAFLITLVFDWGMDYTGIRARDGAAVGSINGKEISSREFSELLKQYTDNQKSSTGKDLDENQLKQAREQVWQSIITRELLGEQIQKLGIEVSDQEIVEWVRGENPPEDLRGSFVDSTGQFRRDLYEQFLGNPNQFLQDPEGADQSFGTRWLVNYETMLRQRRAQEKLQSIVQASVQVAEGEILRRFQDQNIKYEFLYALLDPNQMVKDSDVQVTDDDLRAYYDEHLDQQKVEATRKLKFAQFREDPSKADSDAVKADMEQVRGLALAKEDFIDLVYTYDEKPDSGNFFKHGEMTPSLEAAVFEAKVGEVIGPILERDGYHLLKILGERKSSQEFVRASHILFGLDNSEDSVAVKAAAEHVAKLTKGGGNFAVLAKQHSKDQGSAEKGGDLGWFGKGRMVKSFEEAAFSARLGQVVGPIRSQFGWHVIKVVARDSREVKVADLNMPFNASSQTKSDAFQRAADFAYNARENDFTREAQSLGLDVREATVREKGGVVPGLGVNEPAVRWAFSNNVGEVGDPFAFQTGNVVFMVAEANDAGVRPFTEVKESLRPATLRQLKIKKVVEIAATLASRLSAGDSLTILQSLDPPMAVKRAGPVTLSGSIPGIGRDQHVIGTLSALTAGQISKPVESARGAYLIQLISQSAFDSTAYQTQKAALQAQLLQERKGKRMNEWITKLKETAEIEDHRDQFFR